MTGSGGTKIYDGPTRDNTQITSFSSADSTANDKWRHLCIVLNLSATDSDILDSFNATQIQYNTKCFIFNNTQ